MTTTFFLVRHAAHDNVGKYLAGRLPGISLGAAGLAQARRLAERMRREPLAAIRFGPLERTRETAKAIATACSIDDVAAEPALHEVDFGDAWAGKDFATLEHDPSWRRWNTSRSLARTAGGESMLDVQSRAMTVIETLLGRYAGRAVALVTHSEVIKAIVSHVLGLPIDAWNRFEIGLASISTIVIGDWGGKVVGLNEVTS